MLQAKGFFTLLSIDPGRYTKTLDETMQVQLRQAARAWLRAVLIKVPVYAGTSRGSLLPLGAYLRVSIPISPVVVRRGQGPDIGATQSDYKFGKEGTRYYFEFDENVKQYSINEFYNVSPPIHLKTPGPYNSFGAGEAAFEQYITEELPKRLPRVENIILTKRIDIAGN